MSYNEQKEFRGITLLNAFNITIVKKTLDFVIFFRYAIMFIKRKFNFIFISTERNTILNGCYKRFIAYCLSFILIFCASTAFAFNSCFFVLLLVHLQKKIFFYKLNLKIFLGLSGGFGMSDWLLHKFYDEFHLKIQTKTHF